MKEASLADILLNKIFQSASSFQFLQEYHSLAEEFDKKLEKNLQIHQNEKKIHNTAMKLNTELNEESYTIDYFLEYIKPFASKKVKVKWIFFIYCLFPL